MFTADLSWTDPTDEKVGQRKERKSKEKHASPKTPSIKSSKSSSQESVWRSPPRKINSTSVKTAKTGKSNGSHGMAETKIISKLPPQPLDFSLKDPTLQPAWTFSSTLSPSLPSGASIDLPASVIPDPNCGSWFQNSRNSNSRDGQLHLKSSEEVIDEVHEIQRLSPKSFISRTTRRSAEVCVSDKASARPPSSQENARRSYSVDIQGCLDLDQFKFDYEEVEGVIPPQADEWSSYASNISPTLLSWKAPSEWDVILSTESAPRKRLSSLGAYSSSSDPSLVELTHFQRFIRRMESAGPKIILDRLKEEWNDPVDEEADEELQLEKQLWVLTALQLQTLDKSSQPSQAAFGQLLRLPGMNSRRKILELYGNLDLSTKPQGPAPVPSNVSYLSVPQAGLLPFPYAASSFNHIRASSLPSVVPSAKIPLVFRECHRLLAPGGVLEIRLMDSSPDRKTSGPKLCAWLEDRLSLNLEKSFRCSRPCMLVPSWVKDSGFSLLNSSSTMMQTLRLPTVFDPHNGTVHDELSTLVGRALWKDIWGDFVEERPGEPRWWWEDEEVKNECLERKTIFECATLFAFKEK
ncbi:hypothetical protein AOQ84DRAFT_338101 [Glonium stellatum]|uniref:Methyltransferase type 11 domain-containing protein n=1 Tax=Glonium stellatum TaxID=574774 RepID=A0A8E2JUR9_9PEZI|nr:hypothetical protein AOQ84DRAFT_338101 [Glonium stellatum]